MLLRLHLLKLTNSNKEKWERFVAHNYGGVFKVLDCATGSNVMVIWHFMLACSNMERSISLDSLVVNWSDPPVDKIVSRSVSCLWEALHFWASCKWLFIPIMTYFHESMWHSGTQLTHLFFSKLLAGNLPSLYWYRWSTQQLIVIGENKKRWLTKEDSPFVCSILHNNLFSMCLLVLVCLRSILCHLFFLRVTYCICYSCLPGLMWRTGCMSSRQNIQPEALKLMVRCLVSASEFTSPVPIVRSWSIHSTR